MNNNDAPAFEEILVTLHQALGMKVPNEVTVKMWWHACKDMELAQFSNACGRFFAESKDYPRPAAIRELAGAVSGSYPPPEAAWNMIPKSEDDGGWMCQEMATALAACQDSLDAGERIQARMAFIETYKQLIASKTGDPQWWLTEPGLMDYEERLQWKKTMLEQKPTARPRLLKEVNHQLVAICGLSRTGKGLQPLRDSGLKSNPSSQ